MSDERSPRRPPENPVSLTDGLRDSLFRSFVETVGDYAIFVLDPQGRVVTWNRGAQRIKGYAAAEIIGSHLSRFYPPESQFQHSNGTLRGKEITG